MAKNNPLTKARGNMYGWIGKLWNPLGGKCLHKCKYCYVQRGIAKLSGFYTGDVIIRWERMGHLGTDKTIFVCSNNDLFGEWVQRSHLKAIFTHCREYDNTYLFQTKNPARFSEFIDWFPDKSLLCTTLESNRTYTNQSNAPPIYERYEAMCKLPKGLARTVTIEPIMDFDVEVFIGMIKDLKPLFVSIGVDSKRCNLREPDKNKIIDLIGGLSKFTQVYVKNNLGRLVDLKLLKDCKLKGVYFG